MKEKKKISLNTKLVIIALAVFLPMLFALVYSIHSMISATATYSDITKSITYANDRLNFKESMDYSTYLAVAQKEEFEDLGDGEIMVNGVATVNPYEAIEDLRSGCRELSDMTAVDMNQNQIRRISNTLNVLELNLETLEDMIQGSGVYEENMQYLEDNIYMLTTIIDEGIREYIRVETAWLQQISILQEKRNIRLFLLCLLIVAEAVYLVVVLTRRAVESITKPIQNLCDQIGKVGEGDFTARAGNADIREIQVLSDSFNEMTGEIRMLIDNIKDKEKNLHLVETRLLQEQINPHFLYNTLDSIVWLAEDDRSEDVIAMVTDLSNFFRTTLAAGKDFMTVREERSHIESYLKIQGFRYQDIMEYEIDMEKEISECMIPKLLLQPLVENALYHGVKKKRGKSLIRVWGYREGDCLVFKVVDNGKGMTKETLQELRNNIEKPIDQRGSDSFGLANVNQRIKYYYGKEYGLDIESEENIGTEATIMIPSKKNTNFS